MSQAGSILPFICPICKQPLAEAGRSLLCANKHTFDIARQGYVNLLLKKPENLYEDKALFQARRAVYEAGFFGGVVAALQKALPNGPWLDAGCGEGSLVAALASQNRPAIGLDIARPAVAMAAGSFKGHAWCVGDLCSIPLADGSLAAIVNMLTPANYAEFDRVLRPDGLLLKVVPAPCHLQEIRAAMGKGAYEHTLDEAVAVFSRRFALAKTENIRYTVDCDETLTAQVFAMTPLTAHEARPSLAAGPITVDVTLLVGHKQAWAQ